MHGLCDTLGRNEKCVQKFSRETSREETVRDYLRDLNVCRRILLKCNLYN
jgi:hypothetical protein